MAGARAPPQSVPVPAMCFGFARAAFPPMRFTTTAVVLRMHSMLRARLEPKSK
jgi:hypothetical protein